MSLYSILSFIAAHIQYWTHTHTHIHLEDYLEMIQTTSSTNWPLAAPACILPKDTLARYLTLSSSRYTHWSVNVCAWVSEPHSINLCVYHLHPESMQALDVCSGCLYLRIQLGHFRRTVKNGNTTQRKTETQTDDPWGPEGTRGP